MDFQTSRKKMAALVHPITPGGDLDLEGFFCKLREVLN